MTTLNEIVENIKIDIKPIAAWLTVILLTVMYLTTSTKEPTPQELEEKLKQEIQLLDNERDTKLNELQKEIDMLTICRERITKEKGTTAPLLPCEQQPIQVVPQAQAQAQAIVQTNTWTATGATNPVPERSKTIKDEILMERICAVAPNSPLCGKWDLYFSLKKITEDRLPPEKYGRMWEIMLGIAFAESHIWQNYAKDNKWGTCYWRNNWGWTKYQINDDNSRVHSRQLNGFNYWTKYHWRYTDQHWCNLYPFASIEEFWITKVNGMRFGYPTCILNSNPTPIRCLSFRYVGNPNMAETNWIKNVSSFLVDDKQIIWQP